MCFFNGFYSLFTKQLQKLVRFVNKILLFLLKNTKL